MFNLKSKSHLHVQFSTIKLRCPSTHTFQMTFSFCTSYSILIDLLLQQYICPFPFISTHFPRHPSSSLIISPCGHSSPHINFCNTTLHTNTGYGVSAIIFMVNGCQLSHSWNQLYWWCILDTSLWCIWWTTVATKSNFSHVIPGVLHKKSVLCRV